MNTELAVIGSGPAGLTAAIEAARYGVEVVIIDENTTPGGQLFKQIHKFFGSKDHKAGIRGIDIGNELLDESEKLGVKILLDTVAWGLFDDHKIGISTQDQSDVIEAKRVVLATGAFENTLAFPGWTLPGVIGAGAAQTIMNIHRVRPGKGVLMVGSGNVGLIVSYQMLLAGIEVVGVVEFLPQFTGWHVHAAKIIRESVPIYTSSTIIRAEGDECVEKVEIAKIGENCKPIIETSRTIDVDTVCLAVGLRPRTRLTEMIDCGMKYLPVLGGFVPIHDDNMETTVKDFYVAGDLAGCEEACTALEEGRLAGIAVAKSLGFVNGNEAEKEKRKVLDSLNDLRLGSFGQMRKDAKDELIRVGEA
jgi:thioredoxin reductase